MSARGGRGQGGERDSERPARLVPGAPGTRLLGALSLFWLVACLVLLAGAALAYPGGSWADERARGFDPLVNYWCDLLRKVAVNGESNQDTWFMATLAFHFLAASLAGFWWVAACLLPRSTWRLVGLSSGYLATFSIVAMVLFPYDTQRLSHVITSLLAGGFGFLATAAFLFGELRTRAPVRARHVVGGVVFLLGLGNIGIYVDLTLRGVESAALPVVQKLATLLWALWMVLTIVEAWSARRSAPEPEPAPEPGEAR